MKILGISAFYHDSAAAIIENNNILAAAQEERFTRKKHDSGFPANAVKYCLEETGFSLEELDAVVFYDKPFLKFERLLETYYAFAPAGLKSFLMAVPVWLREKLFLKTLIKDELKKIEKYNASKLNLLFPEHHLSHAASAYYPSPFEDSAILTIDGVGEWATASICHGTGKKIKLNRELRFPHSVGLLYSAFTYFLGFRVNSGEYKLMGLAPYGDPKSKQTSEFIEIIKKEIVSVNEDGSIWLNQMYFNYATGLTMVKEKKWKTLFGFRKRNPEDQLEQKHCNLALAIQAVTEEVVLKMATEAKRITKSNNLCLAGGVALNCVSNGKLHSSGLFENIFIQPAAGDAGGALGAALAAFHIYFENDRQLSKRMDMMSGSYLGPEFSELDTTKMAKKYKAPFKSYNNYKSLTKEVSKLIAQENVIGWMQGRMEFGPRALGARSILGDARSPEMQKKLNLKIKYRESFRPFAPSVIEEDCERLFQHKDISPYMLMVKPIQDSLRKELPVDYHKMEIKDKLYYLRSELPAITHIDFSARIQTVHQETNPVYWQLIRDFKDLSGYGVVVNTSFNVRGEPIVCTPEDAYRCFMRTEMDYLVIGNILFKKEEQPNWESKDNWQEEFVLD